MSEPQSGNSVEYIDKNTALGMKRYDLFYEAIHRLLTRFSEKSYNEDIDGMYRTAREIRNFLSAYMNQELDESLGNIREQMTLSDRAMFRAYAEDPNYLSRLAKSDREQFEKKFESLFNELTNFRDNLNNLIKDLSITPRIRTDFEAEGLNHKQKLAVDMAQRLLGGNE